MVVCCSEDVFSGVICTACLTIVPNVKFGGGEIMLWCCFLGFWLGPSVPVKERLNASLYRAVLKLSAV